MRKQYIIYGHGGSYNHGGEALVKTTIAMLRRLLPDCQIVLSTHFAWQDKAFKVEADEILERDQTKEKDEDKYAQTLAKITKDSICIHIGGDNYCYPNWQRYAMIHRKAKSVGAKSILWSASIEPSMIDEEMLEVFSEHDLIAMRESISYNALLGYGLTNVVKVSDIAFTLEPEEVEAEQEEYVALNISPLVVRKNPLLKQAAIKCMKHIIESTELNILLIPHVMASVDNDYELLKELEALLDNKARARVKVVSDQLSAGQYKSLIAKARFGVFARTHAAIAGYSSGIPVLALGYSTKAVGIARDLGMEKYVVDIDKFSDEEELVALFDKMVKEESNIKQVLAERIGQYKEAVTNEQIRSLLRGEENG